MTKYIHTYKIYIYIKYTVYIKESLMNGYPRNSKINRSV